MTHTLAATWLEHPDSSAPCVYYRQSGMLLHAGRLYQIIVVRTFDPTVSTGGSYLVKATLNNYYFNARHVRCIELHLVGAADVFYCVEYAILNPIHHGLPWRFVYTTPTVRALQRWWRRWHRYRQERAAQSSLFMHHAVRGAGDTWLGRVPVDLLRVVQEYAVASRLRI